MPFVSDMLKSSVPENHSETALKFSSLYKDGFRFDFNIDTAIQILRNRIFGQEEAVKAIYEALCISKANLFSSDRPLYVSLFLGPTGVGKTECVRALSEAIYGEPESFCRIDMNTLSQDHYAASITGSPPGYAGSREGHTLLNRRLIEGSYQKPGLVLFDEIEKASSSVLMAILNILDTGILTLASGAERYDFRNSIILMTSNVASRELQYCRDNKYGFYRIINALLKNYLNRERLIVDSVLKKRFEPEFINRIDSICIFDWIEKDAGRSIVENNIRVLNNNIAKINGQIELEDSAIDFIVRKGLKTEFGARSLLRFIRTHVEIPVAKLAMEYIQSGKADAFRVTGGYYGKELDSIIFTLTTFD